MMEDGWLSCLLSPLEITTDARPSTDRKGSIVFAGYVSGSVTVKGKTVKPVDGLETHNRPVCLGICGWLA